jgi:phosphoribosyl 1,2-cyclic phosphodiesterase
MSLELCILASGSAGNAAIIRTPAGILLVDAGIGPRTLSDRLEGTGVALADISALVLTHLDGDHFTPRWAATLSRFNVPVFCHANKVDSLQTSCPDMSPLICSFGSDAFSPIAGITCEPIHVPHDRLGSHSFVIAGFNYRIGYATDLGRVPAILFDRFRDLNCIALESNYDPQMQAVSARPLFLKRRITGGRGHLSNPQAFAAIRRILDGGRRLPEHIVLLHRSQECNCPDLVSALFSSDARIAPRLTLAHQHERSAWLGRTHRQPVIGEQLTLAF